MDIHASRKAVEELNSLYAEMNGYKIEPPKEKLKTDRNMFNIPKSEQDAAKKRLLAKAAAKRAKMSEGVRDEDPEKGTAERKARLEKKRGMKLDDHPQYKTEALDPVGKEDGDVNNDGKKDSTDSYLMNRRKAIGKAMGKKMKKEEVEAVAEGDGDPCWDTHKQVGMKKKGGRMVPNCVPKTRKESFSDWRSELVEVIDKEEQDKQIKEKNVKNKVTIDPELKLEQVAEELGGELLEWIELDEASYEEIAAKMKAKKKADDRMTVTNADKKANTPAYQKFKAGDKRYKAADHMNEMKNGGDNDPCWDTHKQVGMKKKGGKMVPNCVPKEEVEVSEEGSMSQQEIRLQKRKAMIDQLIAKKRKQSLDKSKSSPETPAKAMGEAKELSVDAQMKIARDHNRKSPEEKKAANSKLLGAIKKVKREKDTRTDAQKMTDATGPRPGSRYRGD